MLVESAVFVRLGAVAGVTALVSTRIYVEVAPQRAATPYIVIYRTGGPPDYVMGGQSGLATAVIGVDCVSDEPVAAKNVAEQVRLALSGYRGTVSTMTVDYITVESIESAVQDLTGQLKVLYVQSVLVSVQYREEVPS